MPGHHFIATQKLYNLVDSHAYNEANRLWLSTLADNYMSLSDEDKWHKLMDWLDSVCPEVNHFRNTRLNVIKTDTSMDLGICIGYFEQFYFLYTTNDENYKLSRSDKLKLLPLIREAATVQQLCEPGRQERFDHILHLYCRDLNWVEKELSRYRYQRVDLLQEKCNHHLRIIDAYSIHTLKLVKKLAQDKQLGIKTSHAIVDAHSNGVNVFGITDYFEKNYEQEFTEYEETAIANLTQYVWLKFNDYLTKKEIKHDLWGMDRLIIPNEYYIEMDLLCKDILGDHFSALTDETVEDYRVFGLKRKKDFINALRELVTNKLCDEGYLVPCTGLHASDDNLLQTLRFKPGIRPKDMAEVSRAMHDHQIVPSPLKEKLKQHCNTLIHYPKLFLSHLAPNLDLLSILPNELKTSCVFMDAVVKEMDDLLIQAIEARDEVRINQLTDCLLSFILPDLDYLDTLSEKVLRDCMFAMKLVQKDGLFLRKLIFFKEDAGIVKAAIGQNSLALCYASTRIQGAHWAIDISTSHMKATYYNLDINDTFSSRKDEHLALIAAMYKYSRQKLPEDIRSYFTPTIKPEQKRYVDFLAFGKMAAVQTLIKPGKISAIKVAELAHSITPELLIRVVNYRASQHLLPLPYCNQVSILEAFNHTLDTSLDDWDSQGYLLVKRKGGKSLEGTNNWYKAFVHYQWDPLRAGFENWEQVGQQLKAFIKATANLLLLTMKTFILYSLMLAAFMVLIVMMLAVELSIMRLFAEGLALMIAPFTATVIGGLVGYVAVMSFIVLSVTGLPLLMTPYMPAFNRFYDLHFSSWPVTINEFRDSSYALFERTRRALAGLTDPVSDNNLQARCELSIERLMGMPDESARQKGELLETLWEHILHDEAFGTDLKVCLDKKYTVSYQGKQQEVSFSSVATTKRQYSDRFRLDEPTSYLRFFADRRLTTTSKLMNNNCVSDFVGRSLGR